MALVRRIDRNLVLPVYLYYPEVNLYAYTVANPARRANAALLPSTFSLNDEVSLRGNSISCQRYTKAQTLSRQWASEGLGGRSLRVRVVCRTKSLSPVSLKLAIITDWSFQWC